MKQLTFLLLLMTGICVRLLAQPLTPQVDSVIMRDGKKVVADVYLPNGGSAALPTILIQTPYNRLFLRYNLPLGIGININGSPYNIVVEDWRGFYGSYAAASGNYDRGKDGYDLVEWIAQQSWSDGKVGTWGPSALGRIQFLTARQKPPHLNCIVPVVASPQYNYQQYYPGGVYREEYVNQLDALGFGLSVFVLANQVYNTLWQYVENVNYYPDSVLVPALMIGGWYDHGPDEMITFFNSLRTSSPANVRDKHRLLMGPWAHGGFGAVQVGTSVQGELNYPMAAGWSDSLALMHFDFYLRNITNGWDVTPYVQYFQMGDDVWASSASWPATGVSPHSIYFSNGGLIPQFPSLASDADTIVYDPNDPSPTVGGPSLTDSLGQGPYDQAPVVESRNDILIYTSDVLPADVVMKGKAEAHLFVSTDRLDTDFAVRLTDVYPDGRSMLVVDGIRRLRFRDGYAAADTGMAVSGSIYEVVVDLPNTAITFVAGHKIRVDITSSNYPRFDHNLNNGGPMYTAGNIFTATNLVYNESVHASYIKLPIDQWPLGVAEAENSNENFLLYPNPTSDKTVVKYLLPQGSTGIIAIRNSDGKLLKEIQLNGRNDQMTINSEMFSNGVYVLSISIDGILKESKRWVIIK
ncbi:MAG: CocE/NonD family hydrolase [Bacteroidota bacterium]